MSKQKTSEQQVELATKKSITRGRKLKLSRQVKGIAAGIQDKALRRVYLNMWLSVEANKLDKKVAVAKVKDAE
jgi:hypothetical protein